PLYVGSAVATLLKTTVHFVNVPAGGTVSLPHGINLDDRAVRPDRCESDNGNVVVQGADDTNVTVTNLATGAQSAYVLCERWHTIPRVFPPGTTDLTPQPFIPASGGPAAVARNTVRYEDAGTPTVDVYVDGANGDDNNDGRTPATALATVQEVYRKFPQHMWQASAFRVNLAGVGGFGADATDRLGYDIETVLAYGGGGAWKTTYQYRGPEMVPYPTATGPATAVADNPPVVAIAGGAPAAGGTLAARFDFTGAAPGWTAHDLEGQFLRITRAGVKVCWELPIANNTADTITVLIPRLAASGILQTDTFEIVCPGAYFHNSVGTDPFVVIKGDGGLTWPASVPNDTVGSLSHFMRVGFGAQPDLGWAEGAILQQAYCIGFDRCVISYLYTESASAFFLMCTGSFWEVNAFVSNGDWALGNGPTETAANDPTPGNRDRLIDVQLVYQGELFVGFMGYAPAHWTNHNGLGLTSWDGWATTVWVMTNSVFDTLETAYSTSGRRPFVQGTGDGGVGYGVLMAYRGSQIHVYGNTDEAGVTSAWNGAAGHLDVDGVVIDYGTAAGEWEEVAGYNGCYHQLPVAAGQRGSLSMIRTVD
ncbi:MAG: hypothetical protein JSV86_07275, partial [Gemmatimonadota bacterium]